MKATISLTFSEFSGNKYKYPVEINTPVNISDIAMQISRQILEDNRKRGCKRFSGKKEIAPAYNLLLKKLPAALDKLGIEFNLPTALQTKEQAFRLAHEANENLIAEKLPDGKYKITWQRVGKSFNRQIAIDVDSNNQGNCARVWAMLETVLNYDFDLNRSFRNGKLQSYHLIGLKVYYNEEDWLYDNCRVLKNDLRREDLKAYLKRLDEFDRGLKGKDIDISKKFKESELYNSVGDFDIPFTLISIRRRKHTIRISKKCKDDRYE